MKERPILFSAPMVRAILAGTKTMTRRIVKGAPVYVDPEPKYEPGTWGFTGGSYPESGRVVRCPYGVPGDRLWVRETWGPLAGGVTYRATANTESHDGNRWTPAIHMPRWASRISLEVTAVRVERLQAITPSDAIAEGAFGEDRYHTEPPLPYPVATFKALWDSINGERAPWASDPWVWVVGFRRVAENARTA